MIVSVCAGPFNRLRRLVQSFGRTETIARTAVCPSLSLRLNMLPWWEPLSLMVKRPYSHGGNTVFPPWECYVPIMGTLLCLVVKTIKAAFWLLGKGLEACFREKYPYDFEINLGWVIKEMKSHGYRRVAMMDAGSDNPGVIMINSESGIEMEVRLHAPLLTNKGYSIIVANHSNNTAVVMQDSASDENKRFLSKYLE